MKDDKNIKDRNTKYYHIYKFWRKMFRRKVALVGLIIVLFFIIIAFLAPFIAPYDPTEVNLAGINRGPSRQHLLGQDEMGRDVLSRIIYGARISLSLGIIAVGIGATIGTLIGLVSGYFSGLIDLILQRFIDILMGFPEMLLAILFVAIFGAGLNNAMIAVGIVSIPTFARLIRGSVLSVREMPYIEAARSMGFSHFRIIVFHVLPNCLAPLIVQSTLRIATAILWASALGFLGLTGDPRIPEWGTMLSKGRSFIWNAPHLVIVPGISILLVVLGFNLLGDGLRDALDPRLDY